MLGFTAGKMLDLLFASVECRRVRGRKAPPQEVTFGVGDDGGEGLEVHDIDPDSDRGHGGGQAKWPPSPGFSSMKDAVRAFRSIRTLPPR